MGEGFRISSQAKLFACYPPRTKNDISEDAHFCTRGVYWTKFECFSSKIQMIKNTNADEARRNYLSGGMDSPCLG